MAAVPEELERQRRIRRTMWWLVALAASFYVGFIVMSIHRG